MPSPDRPRLLIVDDDDQMRRTLERSFGRSYEVFSAEDGEIGLERARSLRPDIVVIDHQMPRKTGAQLIGEISSESPRTILILMTGQADFRALSDSIRSGVHHFVEKPFNAFELENVVRLLLRQRDLEDERDELHARLRDLGIRLRSTSEDLELPPDLRAILETIDQLQRANEKLEALAIRDGLTNLFNRRYLIENLELEVARSRRYERPFSVLFLDIDDFKQLNDQYGHLAGDVVLRGVAETLMSTESGIRSSDFAARYGGEEFCVVLPETPLEGAVLKAERLRRTVEARRWPPFESGAAPPVEKVTVSVGVAAYPFSGPTTQHLLAAADSALYEAKRRGKNRVVVAKELGPTKS